MIFQRYDGDNSSTSGSGVWSIADIVYVAIVGGVLLAAFLEWILWLLAFLYCLSKTFVKARGKGRWSVRILSVIMMVIFVSARLIFLPVMVVTLPLPSAVTEHFPPALVATLQLFAFYAFAALLTIPWLLCVYQLVTHNIGRERKIKTVLDEQTAPKVVIVMPCYNEEPEILLRTVDSIVDCEYPPSCLHVFLSFDGDQENELYLNTLDKLGVPLTLKSYPKSIDIIYRDCRITVSRFPHGGKRSCQKKTFRLIDKVYAEYLRRNDDLFLLFIDSDCILDKVCIQNFMYEMELKPGSQRNMLAMTGVITSTTVSHSLITVLQDMEYIHGQLFERSVESACGAVTCLPGALTILRFSAFRQMAKYYFADKAEQCDDLFDYGKCHLGEDRWLTHLFMIGANKRYQIQMNTAAFCKTEAVQTFRSLLKQRRRWFLGFITNEACMLTDVRLWKRYPLLLLMRLMQNTIRTTALLFFIMVIAIVSTSQKISNLPVGFIAVSLGLNWLLMMYFGAKLGRYKIMLYPLMFVLNPFFNWLYMVYGIFTAGQRTWGGPRADASKADEKTSPEQAVEVAKLQGDELNVATETFKTAAESSNRALLTLPLLPSDHLLGRFAPSQEKPGGWFELTNDSGMLHSNMAPRDQESLKGLQTDSRRDSTDSLRTGSHSSISMPRRVESIFGLADTAMYHQRQAELTEERPSGWTFFEGSTLEEPTNADVIRAAPQTRVTNLPNASESSVSLHAGFGLHRSYPYKTGDNLHLSRQQLAEIDIVDCGERASERAQTSIEVNDSSAPDHTSFPSRPYQSPSTQGKRTGKSPLARRSFTRLASDPSQTPAELEVPPPMPNYHERQEAIRESVDVTRQRRRLSKQPRSASRASSRSAA